MKRYCVLLVVCMFLAVAAISVGQVPPTTVGLPPTSPPPVPDLPDVLRVSKTPESKEPAKTTAVMEIIVEPAKTDEVKEKSVEELLSRLDAIKAQQEELDKAKKETVTLLKEKLKQQKQRLQNLGVTIEEEGGLKGGPKR